MCNKARGFLAYFRRLLGHSDQKMFDQRMLPVLSIGKGGGENLRPTTIGCQATNSIPPSGGQKRIIGIIYTDTEPPSRLPNSLHASREAQTSQFLRVSCDAGGDRTPAAHSHPTQRQ